MQQVDLRRVDLNLLTLFEALFATRSVTLAGDRLDLSQPAASRALQRLRRTLGDPLFVRGSNGLIPTRRAEAVRPALERALQAARQVIAQADFDPASATGTVRLIASDADTATLVPRLLVAFGEAAPGLDIAVLSRRGDPLEALAGDAADLVLGVFPTAPAGFRRQRIYSDSMVCVVRKGHPVLRRGLTLARFVELKHALITISGEGVGVVDQALARRRLARRVAVRIPSFLAAPLVIARSDLVATMPRRIASEFAAIAPLALVEPPLPISGFDLSQVWHERQHADARHAWLRRTLATAGSD